MERTMTEWHEEQIADLRTLVVEMAERHIEYFQRAGIIPPAPFRAALSRQTAPPGEDERAFKAAHAAVSLAQDFAEREAAPATATVEWIAEVILAFFPRVHRNDDRILKASREIAARFPAAGVPEEIGAVVHAAQRLVERGLTAGLSCGRWDTLVVAVEALEASSQPTAPAREAAP